VGADQAVVVVREEVAGRNQLQVLEAVQKVLQALLLSEAACAAIPPNWRYSSSSG